MSDQNQSSDSTAMSPWVMPTMDDFDDMAKGGGGGLKKYLRTGGSKPDYPGVNIFVMRALPAPVGRAPYKKIFRHFYQIPGGGWFGCLCPLSMRIPNSRCLVCELRRQILADNPIDDGLSRDMEPRENILFNAILRNDPSRGGAFEDRGPVIHEGHWSFGKFAQQCATDGVNPFDPTGNGHDVRLVVPRKGSGERWSYMIIPKPSPLSEDRGQIEEWVAQAANLDEESRCLSYQQQEEAYQKALNRSGSGTQSAPPVQHVQHVQAQPAAQPRQVASRALPPAAGQGAPPQPATGRNRVPF